VTLGLYAGGWVAFVLLGASWYQLVVAAVLGVAFTQVAYLGHDVGHRQVFSSRRVSDVAGLVLGNLALGFSRGWWIDKHTRHHANPNHVERDPDIAPGGALAWTPEQTRARGAFGSLFARGQAWLFFPMLFFTGALLHSESVRSLLRPGIRHRMPEAVLLGTHLIGYPVLLFSVLSPAQAVAFGIVQQGVFGFYMGASFAPNHKGMAIIDGTVDYLRRQVLTSRNIRGGPLVDVALGGLNYQIEHHLFPSMPRPNLRRAQPIIQAYCAEIGVAYYETGLLRSYRETLAYLHGSGQRLPTLD
jgi:fatty acid desaturase